MTENVQRSHGGKRRTVIAVGLLLAVAYVGVAVLTDFAKLTDALRLLDWRGCAIVLGLSALNYLLRFQRWQHYLVRLGRSVPVCRSLLYYLSGFAFTVSPAKAGEAVRSMYLKDHGVTYGESIAALFVERLLDLFAIAILASLFVIDHAAYRPLLIATAVFLILAMAAVSQPLAAMWLERLGVHFGRHLARLSGALANLLRASRRLLHPQTLLFGLAIGLLAWAAEGLGFRIICNSLHIGGSITMFVGIYALSVLAGCAAFFLPAGIGGMEVVMSTLLIAQGASVRASIIATLLCRLATLWFAVIIGVAAASTVEMSLPPARVNP